MYIEKKHIIFLVFCCWVTVVFSQKKVSDVNFNNMLSTLLKHSVKEYTPSEINEKKVVFLDAREKTEYNVSHIPNAIWIGYDTFKLKNIAHISKEESIIIYCSVGYRSEKISEKLLKAGYKDVANLYGGIFEWLHSRKTVVNQKGETKRVHTFNKEWSKWLLLGEKVY